MNDRILGRTIPLNEWLLVYYKKNFSPGKPQKIKIYLQMFKEHAYI